VSPPATAGRRPRVLYVTHRVPFPPDKGDRIRNYHVLRQLAVGADVYLAAIADESVPGTTRVELARYCREVEFVPAAGVLRWVRAAGSVLAGRSLSEGVFDHPALRRVVDRWAAEVGFDAAVVSASSLAPVLRRPGLDRVPGFVDVVDVDSQKWLDYAAAARGPRRWQYRLEGSRIRKLERALPTWAAACTLVSRNEADLFDAVAGPDSATVATNGVDLDYFRPRDAVKQEPACAFVGALDYRPNVDAAVWFATEVWPAVRADRPDVEFRLIGRQPAPAVERLGTIPGVRVIGQVPDVRPHVAAAAVIIAPMRLGRGLQNKVIEALAMGKAVVASPAALAALAVEPGVHLERAESPADWVRTVRNLLADPSARKFLGEAGLDYVRQHHDWGRCLRPLTTLIHAAAEPATVGQI
jgi:sugar transferase (PEP-CTERM/EpsH1 system associated)